MVARITNNLIAQRTLADLQKSLRTLADLQQQLSTGRKFTRPSDNPIDYTTALSYRQSIARERRFDRNIDRGLTNLNLAEASLSGATDLVQRVRELTLSGMSGALDAAQYNAIADEIAQIRDQLVQIGNANLEGVYIFGGTQTLRAPFQEVGAGVVRYVGNAGGRHLEIGQGIVVRTNLTGMDVFFHTPQSITGRIAVADTTAALDTQLSPTSPLPTSGDFTLNGKTITVDVTLDSLETLRDKINAADADVLARIDNGRLVLESRRSADIEMASGTSNVLVALGLTRTVSGADITGALGSPITAATDITLAGIDLEAMRLTVDGQHFDIDLDDPAINTVGDVLAAINGSGAGVVAYINAAGTGIDIAATASTRSLSVSNLRRIYGDAVGAGITETTTLAGQGIGPLTSIEITSGTDVVQVDLSSATTFGEVLALINNATAGVEARINAAGTGIDLVALNPNVGNIAVAEVGAGTSAADLGILQTSDDNTATDLGVAGAAALDEVVGKDMFRTLAGIEDALRKGDPEAIAALSGLLGDLDVDLERVLSARSEAGARINRLDSTQSRLRDLDVFLTEILSDNEDTDLAEIITHLTQQENSLQAALSAASRILTPSLMDFMR
ncbi:flagellar hook-associated protein FlgL [bacterium]|nr:flagellar hook-associated protein FlgL [bacterium]